MSGHEQATLYFQHVRTCFRRLGGGTPFLADCPVLPQQPGCPLGSTGNRLICYYHGVPACAGVGLARCQSNSVVAWPAAAGDYFGMDHAA